MDTSCTAFNDARGEARHFRAKNAALPILFAAPSAAKPVEIQNAPYYDDEALSQLGRESGTQWIGNTDAAVVNVFCALYDLLRPCAPRYGRWGRWLPVLVRTSLSAGGCTIGARPADLHITGLEQLRDHQAGRGLRKGPSTS